MPTARFLKILTGVSHFAVSGTPFMIVKDYMQALNDLAKIKIKGDEYGYGTIGKDTAESGILTALPDKFNYFGFWSFSFENSFMARKELDDLYKYWETKIGRKVYWTALSERGNIIEDDEGKWAFIKLTSLIAEADPDSTGHNVHADGGGSFGTEQ